MGLKEQNQELTRLMEEAKRDFESRHGSVKEKAAKEGAKAAAGLFLKWMDRVAESPYLPSLRLVQRFREWRGGSLPQETTEEMAKRLADRAIAAAQERRRRR